MEMDKIILLIYSKDFYLHYNLDFDNLEEDYELNS